MSDTFTKLYNLKIGSKYMNLEEKGKEEVTMSEGNELTLDDLGEVDDQPQLTAEQMKKFMSFVNGKVNQYKQKENKLIKRRTKNKLAKKSRKKNRGK